MSKAASLPTTAVLAFGSVALPLATLGLPLSIYLAPFYAGEIGLPLAQLGLAMVIARLADILIDPFIGSLSDRLVSRWGRRKPWLLGGGCVLLLGMSQLFHPPQGVGMVYFLGWLAVMYVGLSLVLVPHRAWGAELSPDYHVRTHIASVRQFFGTAGLIASTVVPALVLQRAGARSVDVLDALSQLMLVLLPVAVVLCLKFTPDVARTAHGHTPFGLRQSWRAVRRNGPLRCILLLLFVGYGAETFRQTLTVFYARDLIGVKNLGLVYVYYFVSAFCGVPVWRQVALRMGKHRALACGMGVAIATNLGLFTLGRGDVALFTAMFIVKGFCFGSLELLPAAMMADAVDVDRAISKKARAGLLFAMMGVVTHLGQAVGQGLSLNALGLVGYRAAGETAEPALHALRYLYAIAPSALLTVALLITLRYGLTAERHARLRDALAKRLPTSA